MPALDGLNRDNAFRIAERVPTRVLRGMHSATRPIHPAWATC